jgi:hypothetical protein
MNGKQCTQINTTNNKENEMSYAADGPLEPNLPEEVSETFLPNVMGYRVLATEWSDDKYTLSIYRLGSISEADVIQDNEVEYESFPDEDDVRQIIEDTLEERYDRSIG